MKSKKLRLIGVASFVVVLIAVGVMVWPTPKEAMAGSWPVTLELVWQDGLPRNVHATAQLFTDLGIPVSAPIPLIANQDFSEWTALIYDNGNTPAFVVCSWDYAPAGADLGFRWDDDGGQPDNPPCQEAALTGGTAFWRNYVEEE